MERGDGVVLLTEGPTASFDTSDASNGTMISESCPLVVPARYPSYLFGTDTAVPEWEAACVAVLLLFIIIATIVGNVLVVLSVFNYTPLCIVQNFFIVSLAVADLTVAILVMPVYVVYGILGRWVFPGWMCKMWLTCDVMCCTASILNMCAIALDRYRAIKDPINYAQKRTLKRVLLTIALVWVLSFLISSPPLMGWNDWPDVFEPDTPCHPTSQPGYVIYSSLGSFYIPLFIMGGAYLKIFTATRHRLRRRARASRLNALNKMVRSASDLSGNHPQGDQVSVRSGSSLNDVSVSSTQMEMKKGRRVRWRDEQDDAQAPVNQLLVPKSYPPGTPGPSSQQIETELTDCNAPKSILVPTKVVVVPPQPPSRPTHAFQLLEERQKISLSRERRAARVLGIVMGVFVVNWMPFFLMYVIRPFCPTCCPSDKLVGFITWLGYLNSTFNPVIYTIFNIEFRVAFKKLMSRR